MKVIVVQEAAVEVAEQGVYHSHSQFLLLSVAIETKRVGQRVNLNLDLKRVVQFNQVADPAVVLVLEAEVVQAVDQRANHQVEVLPHLLIRNQVYHQVS